MKKREKSDTREAQMGKPTDLLCSLRQPALGSVTKMSLQRASSEVFRGKSALFGGNKNNGH